MNKVSIVTVTYNNGNELEQTIKSVVNQKRLGANIEFIIIDGASTDNTRDIYLKYQTNIDVFISEPDTGIFNAMNKGFDIANGDSIVFLNSGDFFYQDFDLKKFQEKYNLAKFNVFTFTIQKYNNVAFLRPKKKQNYDFYDFGHQGVFVSKNYYKNIRYDEDHKINADSLWMEKIWKLNNNIVASEITAVFSLGGVSNNFSWRNFKKLWKSHSKISEKIKIVLKCILYSAMKPETFYRKLYKNKYEIYEWNYFEK